MLLPQDVSETQNAFHCTMAVIYSVCAVRGERLEHVDVLMTSLCCGYGKMSDTESFRQIQMGLKYWADCYAPEAVHLSPTSAGMRPAPAGVSMPAECPFGDMVVREPTLRDQPRLYMNTEWFAIAPADIINVYEGVQPTLATLRRAVGFARHSLGVFGAEGGEQL